MPYAGYLLLGEKVVENQKNDASQQSFVVGRELVSSRVEPMDTCSEKATTYSTANHPSTWRIHKVATSKNKVQHGAESNHQQKTAPSMGGARAELGYSRKGCSKSCISKHEWRALFFVRPSVRPSYSR